MSSYSEVQVDAAATAIGNEIFYYPTSAIGRNGTRAWYVRLQNDGSEDDFFVPVAGPFATEKEAQTECRRILVRAVLDAAEDAAPSKEVATDTLNLQNSNLVPSSNKEAPLGRFSHHPDPAIDFLVEFEEIENIYANNKIDSTEWPLPEEFADRVWKAMEFRVGGDANCILAKQKLRKIEADLNNQPDLWLSEITNALQPFSNAANALDYEGAKWADHETHWGIKAEITIGALRRARTALATLTKSLNSGFTPPLGWILAPIDDDAADFANSTLPMAMISAGSDALEKATKPSDIDWDQGMQAVAVYRAMIAAIQPPPISEKETSNLKQLLTERDDFIVANGLWGEFCARVMTTVNNESAVIKGILLAAKMIENSAPKTSGADYGLSSESERAATRESERVCYAFADSIRALALRVEKSGMPKTSP